MRGLRPGRLRLGVITVLTVVAVLACAGLANARLASDTTPPTISGATDITAVANADCYETFCATVTFPFTVSDPDDSPDQITVVCNNAMGSTFFWGMSYVTCQAHDPAGNLSAPVMFTVTVTAPPPTFQNVPAPITTTATGQFGSVVTFVPPTATDVGGRAVAVTCDHLSGITYPIGTTTVTCTAPIQRNDSNGHPITGLPTGTTQFTITVNAQSDGGGGGGGGGSGGGSPGGGSSAGSDTTAPTILQNANLKVNAATAAGAAVTYGVTATDPDNGTAQITLTCAPASGTTFTLGAHEATKATTVTCQAHDPGGNQAKPMSFTVTVLGAHDQIVALEHRVAAATDLSKSRKAALDSKLAQADLDFRKGARSRAGTQLGSFISRVGQFRAPVTHAQKSTWITAAARIIALIG